jgi:uncharacterized membrane protein
LLRIDARSRLNRQQLQQLYVDLVEETEPMTVTVVFYVYRKTQNSFDENAKTSEKSTVGVEPINLAGIL